MNRQNLINSFVKEKVGYLDVNNMFAVYIPVLELNQSLHLLFEVRSQQLSQPGEICFPGGKIEPGESPMTTAIRETVEELNIDRSLIEVMGPLDRLITPFNVLIYPFWGFINLSDIKDLPYNQDEVSSIFTVPLDYLLKEQPIIHNVKVNFSPEKNFPYHLISNGEKYEWRSGNYPVYFYPYGEKMIWGITAKILKNFLDSIYE
ncbi:NUDIX hydrolase [Alkaliphilus crotonatoxidans]